MNSYRWASISEAGSRTLWVYPQEWPSWVIRQFNLLVFWRAIMLISTVAIPVLIPTSLPAIVAICFLDLNYPGWGKNSPKCLHFPWLKMLLTIYLSPLHFLFWEVSVLVSTSFVIAMFVYLLFSVLDLFGWLFCFVCSCLFVSLLLFFAYSLCDPLSDVWLENSLLIM